MRPMTWREEVAALSLRIVLITTGLNLAFNLGAILLGHGYPYSFFLFRPDDNFSDFFSLLQTYPGGAVARPSGDWLLHALMPQQPPSLGAREPGLPSVTHFHMMPLSTLLAQALIGAMRFIDPSLLFFLLLGSILGGWCLIAHRFGQSPAERATWIKLGLFAYPMLMMVQRGNLFAGASAMLIVAALLLGLERRAPIAAAIMLAIAVNIRPNVILLALPMLALYWPHAWRFSIALGAVGIGIVVVAMLAANALYPAYRLDTFLGGLRVYYELYVVHDWGLPFGSSLLGMMKLVFGPHAWFDAFAAALSLGLMMLGIIAHRLRRIGDAHMLFVTVGAACLGTSVLSDYHLLVMLIVVMGFAAEAKPGDARSLGAFRVALVTTSLLLAPKNYLYFGLIDSPISLQVAVNPLLLILAIAAVLVGALGRQATAPRSLSRAIQAVS